MIDTNLYLLNKLGLNLGMGFAFVVCIICPRWHRYLRIDFVYYTLLVLATFLGSCSIYLYPIMVETDDRKASFLSFYFLTFLIFYKIYDLVIKKTKGRNLYFSPGSRPAWEDEEDESVTVVEMLMQFSLPIFPWIISHFFWEWFGTEIY